MKKPEIEELKKQDIYVQSDTIFSANARVLQNKWRIKHNYKMGKYPPMKKNYGNVLDNSFAKKTKNNFLTDEIKILVEQEIEKSKSSGALIDQNRMYCNLLSSQPLCFNIFGELKLNLNLATLLFKKIFPNIVDKIINIEFEYSPGRKKDKYLNDGTAFDVFVEYLKDNKKGFLGIEVKYAESLREETLRKADKNYKNIYKEITENCNMFEDNSVDNLRKPPFAQIWRDHLLSIVLKNEYTMGYFVFLYPSENTECKNGIHEYKKYLKKDHNLIELYLEDIINELKLIIHDDWVKELSLRYLGK